MDSAIAPLFEVVWRCQIAEKASVGVFGVLKLTPIFQG